LVGQGPLKTKLRQQAKRLGLAEHVSFLGRVDKDQVPAIMQAHLALIFPSVRDTSGNVVLEAMAYGLPVVAFRHQGVVQMVDDDSGYLIDPQGSPQDVEEFSQAIEKILTDPSARKTKITRSLLRVKHELSWSAKWTSVLGIYEKF
jgi:glycosyltransferase involved in cell wall biosynthesis